MELRDAKVMTERELSSASARLTRLSALVEAGQEDEAATSGEMERLSREATDLGLEVECHAINLSMKYTLKMGQIEIPDQAVVPDFADSCLMGRQTVEVLNGEVVARSSHKIDRMREISGSRGELTTTAWESGALDLRAEHKLQHISELQLLHVTREIQNFMQDPERALAYNREVQLQNQLVANEKAHRLKMALLRKRVGSYEEAAEEQELENGYLRENTAKASAALGERERMNEALVDADNTPAKQRARTFRNIVTNQKLLDISRSQMEELHFLANELHRLKQRSYPAFTVPSHDPAALDRLRPGTTGHDLPGAGKYSRRPLSGTSNMRDRPRSTSARVRPPPSTALYATGTSRPGSQQATRVPSAGQRIGSSLPPTPPSRAGSRRPPAAAPPSQ
uniref:DUF4201 domain-containing protein n=1 Tax=Tetraselmis chuii TaxID=63592 RepID=A0A7S1SNJ9_9CHLO